MTVAYTTADPLGEAVRVTAGAAVAALSAIDALTELRPDVKWVNDLYLNGCKVGGILTEAVTLGNGLTRMVVGIGINLTTTDFPEGLRAPAACLFAGKAAEGLSPDFSDRLAGEITRRLLELAEASPDCPFAGGLKGEACLDFYRRRLLYVGERVTCTRGGDTFEGVVEGVDGGYALLVRVGDTLFPLSSGEISVRPLGKS
jgi:BirA family biotin operon repressor/biotin-[acetyl-CoA-carboxylase] ligase